MFWRRTCGLLRIPPNHMGFRLRTLIRGEFVSRKVSRREILKSTALGVVSAGIPRKLLGMQSSNANSMIEDFIQPPDDARPWVYWYFMDGNLTREGMEADLAAMKRAGIGGAIY